MVARQSREAQEISVDIAKEKNTANKILSLPPEHGFTLNKQTQASLRKAYDIQPGNYEELLAIRGIGPKAIRALALVSQLIYGAEPSWKDPAKFSFAHGGKDGIPFEIDRKHYNTSIEILRTAIENAKIADRDRLNAIKRLHEFI